MTKQTIGTVSDVAGDIARKIRSANNMVTDSINQQIEAKKKKAVLTNELFGNQMKIDLMNKKLYSVERDIISGINTRNTIARQMLITGCSGFLFRNCPEDRTKRYLKYKSKSDVLDARLKSTRRTSLLNISIESDVNKSYGDALVKMQNINTESGIIFDTFLNELQPSDTEGGALRRYKTRRRKTRRRKTRSKPAIR